MIIDRPVGLAAIVAMMSVLTFKPAVILYLFVFIPLY
jgi:hypothetical protein